MSIRSASVFFTVVACLLAVAAVITFLVKFESIETLSGSLGLAAFGVAMVAFVLRRRVDS